jgi:acetylornithine deacetylase/succinyl-diaminopimelate desuccinylase-like protein
MTDTEINWNEWTEQATEWLSSYIRVNTVNPPGNETIACDFIGKILDAEGIPYQLYDPGDNRATLVATLKGDGSRGKSLILLNHTDVVPFEIENWTVDPLGGEIRDGYIWGRGAQDMKGTGIVELVTFLLHKRLNLPLKRDLVFMAVADEEAGSAYGVEFLDREHPELLDCEYVINEGGSGSTEVLGIERDAFNIGVSEKGPLWLKLTVEGTPGHGSVPHNDNAADHLVRAVNKILDWERPFDITPEVRNYFEAIYEAGILKDEPTDEVLKALAADNPRIDSMQKNSVALTTLRSGVKHNVIPSDAEATLDCRLVPGYDPDKFVGDMIDVINDDRIKIERVFQSSTPASPTNTELWDVMAREARNLVEDALILPGVSTGFTDSRVFRRKGMTAYGFSPFLSGPSEAGRVHGHDERLSIDNLHLGIQIMHATVRGICG